MPKLHAFLIPLFLFIGACTFKTEFQKLEARELAKGIRQDSLFLGISLGMTQKDFYTHCWELNKRQVIRQGASNLTVQYELDDLEYPALMNFYPTFHDNKIHKMPTTIYYESWAPWNKHLFSDSLQYHVVDMLEKWYGGNFLEINHPEKGKIFAKVDGNRRIVVARKDDMKVNVVYIDLLVAEDSDEL